jgi:hypothetical protein
VVALKQRSRSSFQNVLRFRDAAGRPLGEGKLPADLRADVPMVLRSCHYPGSRFRHAHPMNLSALQQLKQNWEDCRRLLGWLRAHHLAATGADRVTLSGLWQIARCGQSLPGWLLFRRVDPVADGAVPTAVAAVFKVVIGITFAAQSLHLTAMLDGSHDEAAAVDVPRLLDHIESHGLLVGPSQVCAGPRRMIAEVLALLVDGDPHAPPHADTRDAGAARLIGDIAAFGRYAAQAMRFQAAGYVADVFGRGVARAVVSNVEADANCDAAGRDAAAALEASLSTHALLTPALGLTPPQLAGLARAIHRFMAGPQFDGSATSAMLVCLIDAWLQPRDAARRAIAGFVPATIVDRSAPLIELLATHLMLEHYWLLLNLGGDAALEQLLGHQIMPHSLAALDAQLGDTPLRRCFGAIFGVSISQDEAGAHLRRADGELCIAIGML